MGKRQDTDNLIGMMLNTIPSCSTCKFVSTTTPGWWCNKFNEYPRPDSKIDIDCKGYWYDGKTGR